MPAPKRTYLITEEVKQLLTERYDSRIRGAARGLAARLGWPEWAVKRVARRLGLTRPWPPDRRAWTEAEVIFLEEWTGRRSSGWIAKRLGRGETSVLMKLRKLGLSARIREGYTIRDLAQCMGVDHRAVDRWIDKGWLKLRMPYGTNGAAHRISEDCVKRFLRTYRQEWRLDKVNQTWFLGIVFGPGE